jgi:uncharacterized lipoprotein
MRVGWGVLWLGPLLLTVGGCHTMGGFSSKACHDPQPYAKARSVPPLIVPPGLDAPDTTNALHLPQLNEPAPPPRKGKDPCLDEPPSFKVSQPGRTPEA